MRIEVLINQVESHLYPLSQPRIMIGSSRSCDIVLTAEGVSRKHLLVICEDDNYFVIDQGSTNGSFINEERLTPGKKVPFTSFFPVRLSESIFLTLLSDDATRGQSIETLNVVKGESSYPSLSKKDHSKTFKTVSSAKPSKAAQTKKEVDEKRRNRPKAKNKSEAESKLFFSLIIAALIIVVAAYIELSDEEANTSLTTTAPVENPVVPKPLRDVQEKIALITPEEATSISDLNSLINELKCISDNERLLCEAIPTTSSKGLGVTQIGTTLNVFVDADSLLEKSLEYFAPPNEGSPHYEVYKKQRNIILVGLLLKDGIELDLSDERLKDFKLVFGIFTKEDNKRELLIAFAGYPESIQKLREKLSDPLFESIKQFGLKNKLDVLKSYILLY